MKDLFKLPMNLQFFAEQDDEQETGADDENQQQDPPERKFTRAEMAGIIAAEVKKATEAIVQKKDEEIQQAKTEAEKLAQMNEDQKSEYERQQREDALSKREADITARELRAQVTVQLTEDNLPAELTDLLNFSDADACNDSYQKVKDAFAKATGSFDEAVQTEVNKRLANSADQPLGNGQSAAGNNPWSKESFNLTEQGRILTEDPERAKLLKQQAKNKK
ncbi:DUF4355 domain-containing protein [Candidatus Enterococcus leclercqii]|uniref:DUF4355 domain-containing protein n=1 Tax=Candidatus Enterococcus leclercqii TaxID=1857218 RepID=UPI00137AB82C|nr:DUF4355 domain-containing protein [Enterococcus sp. CU9D]KAF1291053.1 hypothetical protein BAU14_10700 [Enterococcus sp. CU9D]